MKIRFDNIPLHINILSIFILLTSLLCGSMLLYNYAQTSDAALLAADRLLEEISDKVTERTSRIFEPAFLLADEATLLPDLSMKPDLYGHPSAPLLMSILRTNRSILSAYMGYEDGDFLLLSHIENVSASTRDNLGAPEGAHYNVQTILRRADGKRVRISKFLGPDLRIMSSHFEKNVGYDPRKRPWYTDAYATDHSVLTDLYVYTFSKEVGLTVARRFDGRTSGVFGVDLALSDMSRFLARQKVGEASCVFIFKAGGELVAYPDEAKVVKSVTRDEATLVECALIEDLGEPVLSRYHELFRAGGGAPFARKVFTVDGRDYIARAEAMPERYGPGQYLGMVVPMEEFTGPIIRAGKKSILVSLLLLLAFVPVIIWVSRRISKPIRLLAEEAERIRRFELDAPLTVSSRITEIKYLSTTMRAMKSTLASFGVYVPKALVREIMKRDIVPRLGGERQELTLLFSDIANFTTLSESMNAEELAHKVSDYFQALGSVILEGGGTIDKFIGDAIMAFWNAPTPTSDHAAKACFAALRCRASSRALNQAWEARGEPAMHTRFGLHSADAVVGNIGSPDRMNYTAMGAAVNLASRLEGLNKHFKTEILASESVAQRCADRFLFRTVGKAVPKGALAPVAVFELLGMRCDSCAGEDDISASQAQEEYCMRWEKAYALYLERRWAEAAEAFKSLCGDAEDPVAAIYLNRARAHNANPPGPDWTGVETMHSK
ncbi:adenylate/guanylate cyclase domain-containing protein [Desulfocurvus sp. DL9XJH121]